MPSATKGELSIEKFQVLRSKTWGVNGKAVSPLWNFFGEAKIQHYLLCK
jgi:hypothetical protein